MITTTALLCVLLVRQDDPGKANEGAMRDAFAREFKDKVPAKRAEAVRKLHTLHEEKTLLALAGALRDPAVEVRRAAAETIGTCVDVSGAAIKPLGASLLNRKEDVEVRTLCAKAFMNVQYKAEAIDALIQTISGIGEQEKDLYRFGADCTVVLNWVAAQDFGAGKETPDKWKKWWAGNKAKVVRDDLEKLSAHRKSAAPKGK